MSEHHRAFVVILVLSLTMFALVRKPAVALGMEEADFARRRNLWLAATAAAFLAYNFWIFVLVIGALLLFSARKDSNPLALYLFLLFATLMAERGWGGLIARLTAWTSWISSSANR